MTASASAIAGTSRGWANDTASTRRAPAATSRAISSTLASVGRITASFWRPSRGLTSTMVTSMASSVGTPGPATVPGLALLAGALGRTPAGGGVKDPLAQAQLGGGDLDQLVGADPLDGLLQRQ